MTNTARVRLGVLFGVVCAIGCAARDNEFRSYTEVLIPPTRVYATAFFEIEDGQFAAPSDSVFLSLYNVVDTSVELGPGANGAPKFAVPRRSPVVFELLTEDGTQITRPIRDTIDAGDYFLTADTRTGMYELRAAIDGVVSIQTYLLINNQWGQQ